MENEKFTGHGVHAYEDGSEYSGDFVQGRPEGNGKMTFSNQDIYDGKWKNGKMHGKGEYRRFNLAKDKYVESYIGDFADGIIQGVGRMQYENRTVYDGQWQNGKRTGLGTLWISPNEYFHGLWKFDEPIRGIKHFENGDWYEGTFKNGKFHGYGHYFYSSGVLFDGEFENGSPSDGICIYPDGTIKTISKS